MTEQSDNIAELLTLTMTVNEWGTLIYRNSLGQLHRQHGPAVEWVDGYKSWWLNGNIHRTTGPAIEYNDGSKAWYQNGQRPQSPKWHQLAHSRTMRSELAPCGHQNSPCPPIS